MSSLGKASPGEGTRGERPSGRHKLGPGRECQPYWQGLARTGTGKAGRNQTLQDIEAYCDANFMEVKVASEDFKQQGHHVCVYF